NTQTIRINPPGGSGGLTAVSELPPIIKLIESLSPVLGSLFRAIESLPINVQDSIGPHDLILDPSRLMPPEHLLVDAAICVPRPESEGLVDGGPSTCSTTEPEDSRIWLQKSSARS
ncbi:hypothetical protein PV325_000308, partial [Microctonus aethiopoides]